MKNKIIILFCAMSICFFSCKKNLSSINDNPNAPEQVDPQFLLSDVIYQAAKNNAEEGWKNGNLLAQLTSNIEFFPIDRYDVGTNTELWNNTYQLLNDVNSIEISPLGNDAYTGVSMIMKSMLSSLLTDLWTDVPYSQAIKGLNDGNFSPAYDTQEAIYTGDDGILATLKQAVALLSGTTATISGDILYQGDLNKWIRLANSLQVRYLVRISKKVDVSAQLQTLINDDMLIQSNAENAVIPFLASAPNQWYLINEREGRYEDVRMSKTAENIMVPLDDARTGVYYKPTALSVSAGDPMFKGLPNGLSKESQNAYNLNDISLIGSLFRDDPSGVNAPLMTYAELEFLKAEAAQKGFISGDASMYYNEAITASHEYFYTTVPPGYLASDSVALNGTDDLKKIMTQKWISNFLNGYEAWIDVRRTGFPVLPIPLDNLNNNIFPVRFRYPTTEQAANKINYDAAVAHIGGDTYNSKGWWEN
ncbi:MAG: SusD/RagB family nutrient-binding outer membrane lipoprotein [Chitinophagaceae bacterium]